MCLNFDQTSLTIKSLTLTTTTWPNLTPLTTDTKLYYDIVLTSTNPLDMPNI